MMRRIEEGKWLARAKNGYYAVYDFVPVVEVKDFLNINRFSDIKKAPVQRKRGYSGEIVADLLRGAVICGNCNQPFTAGITHKKQGDKVTHYFYYRCDTPNCPFRGKSVRANVIVLNFLTTCPLD